ncbi:MAG TPA: BTAD domain-containing putative transcriptional regulator, partial [Candidatus Limnocylindrales bacterium]
PRERLESLLARVDDYRLGLVVGPAGSGKTTLLARLAELLPGPVAWYRAESWDGETPALMAHLSSAIETAIGRLGDRPASVEEIVRSLDAWPGRRLVLVVDDLYLLEGSPAEHTLERLVDYAPASLTILAGSRTQPAFNLSRLRVSGALVEVGADDLRFRPWEVERLFRDFYLEYVPPQELALLARRTEGWAAGLQLFHLATRDKSPDERRRILAGVTTGSRLTREYLTRNVLADLSDELRMFLVETSVLGRLTGPLCDALLERSGSAAILAHLERRQIFTAALDDEGSYRYHEVLRSHLLSLLLEAHGERETEGRHLRAARLLEGAGALPEALVAYCHADDWGSVERILGHTGAELVAAPATWMDALPPALVRHDPWLILASARRARAEGRWSAALEAFARAERAFGSADDAAASGRERVALAIWLEPNPPPGSDWNGLLRSGTVREPNAARRSAEEIQGFGGRLVAGLSALSAGDVVGAVGELRFVAEDEATPPIIAAAARLAAGVASLLRGDPRAGETLEQAVDAADGLGARWLARLGRVALVVARGEDLTEVALARAACSADHDGWGEGLSWLLEAWAAQNDESAATAAGEAARMFRRLGAGVLEAWAGSLLALYQAGAGDGRARDTALRAELFARSVGTAGPRYFAYLALTLADPEHGVDYRRLADSLGSSLGLAPPPSLRRETATDRAAVRRARDTGIGPVPATDRHDGAASASRKDVSVAIACFGGFSLAVDGRQIDLSLVKPRVRTLLRFLAVQAGRPVHREVIVEALWPGSDRSTGSRSLHVALSNLRRLLELDAGPARQANVMRDGDAYRLDLPSDASVDVADFEAAVSRARAARAAGDDSAARRGFRQALDLHRGELLPEDGPAEWVVEPRDRLRALAVDSAVALGELSLRAGVAADAAAACTTGLLLDRYHDPLWRLLIEAHEAAGDPGAARRAR